MHRILPGLMLVLLAGCASPRERQIYWDTQRAAFQLEQGRLHNCYRSGFKRGFQDAWAGRYGIACRFDSSDEPDADAMLDWGYMDGQSVGNKVRMEIEIERLNKEQAKQDTATKP